MQFLLIFDFYCFPSYQFFRFLLISLSPSKYMRFPETSKMWSVLLMRLQPIQVETIQLDLMATLLQLLESFYYSQCATAKSLFVICKWKTRTTRRRTQLMQDHQPIVELVCQTHKSDPKLPSVALSLRLGSESHLFGRTNYKNKFTKCTGFEMKTPIFLCPIISLQTTIQGMTILHGYSLFIYIF